MAPVVKILICGTSLVGVSCGGYVVYKSISSSSEEKTKVEDPSKVSQPSAAEPTTDTNVPKQQ